MCKLFKNYPPFFLLVLFGCAVVQEPVAYTGSKSDGIVTVSYEYPAGLKPTAQDWMEADREANQRCANWGYSKADKFRRTYKTCTQANYFGCVRWREYLDYQCVD